MPDEPAVQSTIDSLVKIFEESMRKQTWVTCPACSSEWTKLRPCNFVWDQRSLWNHVCVECAETVKSLDWIAKRYPIPGVTIQKRWLARPSTTERSKVYAYAAEPREPEPPIKINVYSMAHPQHQCAIVNYSDNVSCALTSQLT